MLGTWAAAHVVPGHVEASDDPGERRFVAQGMPTHSDVLPMSRGEPPPSLRAPGQYARERGIELRLKSVLVAIGALLTLLVAWQGVGMRGLPLALLELGVIGVIVRADRLYSDRAGRWLRGADGERAVGAICAELEADGWHAIHDVSLGRGNVDHILIGPGGIFAIETKSHRGRIRIDLVYPKMLTQANAEKKLVERITGRDVQALLVFSRAYLVGSVPAQRNGVTILPARLLRHYLSRRRPILDSAEAERLHAQLAVAPSTG
jgi:hypothetical protein